MAELAIISPLISLTAFLSQWLYKKWNDHRSNLEGRAETNELFSAIGILKVFSEDKVKEFQRLSREHSLDQDTLSQ